MDHSFPRGLAPIRAAALAMTALAAAVFLTGCPYSTNTGPTLPSANQAKLKPAVLPPLAQPRMPKAGEEADTTIRFTVIDQEAGIEHTYRNGSESKNHRILESLGGGGGWFDFDADGLLDLFLAGGGHYEGTKVLGLPGKMYRHRGDWKFEQVTQQAGEGFPARRYSHGCHAADFDNDGFLDFMVCGYGGLELWHNLGDGTFEEIHTAAELHDELWSSCVGWGDFNRDGSLDVYVVHYVDWSFQNDPFCPAPEAGQRESCPPRMFKGLPHQLYFSNGDGTFRDVSREAGLRIDPGKDENGIERNLGKGLGVLVVDIDVDGDQDIYVANDTVPNFLYVNQGDGTFVEDGTLRGAATDNNGMANGSMGVDFADYNRDGLPDLWVANYQHEAMGLYRNDGDGIFTHVSEPMGISAIGGLYVAFGTLFADLNRDGFEDIVLSNGHVQFYPVEAPIRQVPVIFISEKGEFFRRQKFDSHPYLGQGQIGRGLVGGDVDNDGDIDLCCVHNNNEPVVVLRNDSADEGQWLRVRLIGTASNRDGSGARLILHTSEGDLVRYAKGASSYASHCDMRPMWGLPKGAVIDGLTIAWPSGQVQEVLASGVNTELVVVEP